MEKYVREWKMIPGNNIYDKVFILRLFLTHFDVTIPFKFQRRQILLDVSF